MKQTIHQPTILRRIVFEAVPEYKASNRVKVSFDGTNGMVGLCIGVLNDAAIELFETVGTLNTTKAKIVKAINRHFFPRKAVCGEVMTYVPDRYSHGFYFKLK